MRKQRGFTLIEILVVIAILGILAAIGLTSYRTANQKARDSRRQADIQAIRSALEVYRSEEDSYPAALSSLTSPNDYFSGQGVPADPQGGIYEYSGTDCDVNVCSGYTLVLPQELGVETTFTNP